MDPLPIAVDNFLRATEILRAEHCQWCDLGRDDTPSGPVMASTRLGAHKIDCPLVLLEQARAT